MFQFGSFQSFEDNMPVVKDHEQKWDYKPIEKIKVGGHVASGDVIGLVHESVLVKHTILVPLNACGTITYVALAGSYNINVRHNAQDEGSA
jgi:vacuolar-type H+-ATPase catalytic subunit A/Vma1